MSSWGWVIIVMEGNEVKGGRGLCVFIIIFSNDSSRKIYCIHLKVSPESPQSKETHSRPIPSNPTRIRVQSL